MEKMHPSSILVRGGIKRSQFGETSEAIYFTSGFVYHSAEAAEARFKGEEPGFIYTRYGNPTVRMFEARLAALEGAEDCYGTATGMAAVWVGLLAHLKAGDHLVASRALFGSCVVIVQTLLPRFGIETTLVDGADLDAWRNAIRPNTKVFFVETPANPTLALIDLAAVAEIAHAHDVRLVVDNALASPMVQKPMQLGADVVIYSATKHIDGQGRALGGAVLASAERLQECEPFMRHTGPTLSPFNAWVLLKGMETLALRIQHSSASALHLAQAMSSHPAAQHVHYPFLDDFPQLSLARRQMTTGGTLLALDLGSKGAAFAFLNALRVIEISNNFGDAKSLATHPASTTHSALTETARTAADITDGLVRLSIGLEDARDLLLDVNAALNAADSTAGR